MRALLRQSRFLGLIPLVGIVVVVTGYLLLQNPAPPLAPVEPPLVPDPPTPDPRLTFPTSFRNVHPDVQYVGDANCARCHLTIDKAYHAHPMGRSAATIAKADQIERSRPGIEKPVQFRAVRGTRRTWFWQHLSSHLCQGSIGSQIARILGHSGLGDRLRYSRAILPLCPSRSRVAITD